MSSTSKAKLVTQIALPPQRASISAAVDECIERTVAFLLQSGAAPQNAITDALEITRRSNAEGKPSELLETLSQILDPSATNLPATVAALADKISLSLVPSPPHIPFAGKFIAPNAFYEKFPELQQLGRALLAPVIFAEDSDAIGTAALNPIAATIMAEEITAAVARRIGIRPFVTAVVLNHASWVAIIRKHFSR